MRLFIKKKKQPEKAQLPVYDKNPYADSYFENLERINSMWSVISNFKDFNGEQASRLESLCLQNIRQYKDMCQYDISKGIESPHHAPAFVRLTMLYTKQNNIDGAILTCADAIKSGAYEDGTAGKMYGRLARLISKADSLNISDEIRQLTIIP